MKFRNDVLKKRGYDVRKSNDVIKYANFDFTLREQKATCYIASMFKPPKEDESGKKKPSLVYKFPMSDLLRVLGIDNGGKSYVEIKEVLEGLRNKSTWITLPNGIKTMVAWLDRVAVDPSDNQIYIKIDDRMAEFLFVEKYFTIYQLAFIIPMKSKYSIILYEILKSYHKEKTYRRATKDTEIMYEVNPDEIVRWFVTGKKTKYRTFSRIRPLIERAVEEINKYTDLNVEVSYVPDEYKIPVNIITFKISNKLKNEIPFIRYNNNCIIDKAYDRLLPLKE